MGSGTSSGTDQWNTDNTYIYVILGDKVNPDPPNNQISQNNTSKKKVVKYTNYSLMSDAILIKRLAMKNLGIHNDHIVIFAKGEKYNFSCPTNKKILSQLTIDEIYISDLNEKELNFVYYNTIEDIESKIQQQLRRVQDAHILLYLDDHGDKGQFSDKPFFDYYNIFFTIPHHSLFILNDSCNSGSIINICENYFKISKALDSCKKKK